MLSKICGCGQNNVHETSPVKKAGVSLTLMATAGALFTLGALLLLSHKLEATRLAPLGRYLSQHSQAARISGIVSITLGALTSLTLATYLSCPSNKKPDPFSIDIKDTGSEKITFIPNSNKALEVPPADLPEQLFYQHSALIEATPSTNNLSDKVGETYYVKIYASEKNPRKENKKRYFYAVFDPQKRAMSQFLPEDLHPINTKDMSDTLYVIKSN